MKAKKRVDDWKTERRSDRIDLTGSGQSNDNGSWCSTLAMAQFSDADEGKPVMMGDEKVGMITKVERGTAHVDPDAGITDKIKATLDWGDQDEDTYPLQEQAVDTITDDEVRLRSNL